MTQLISVKYAKSRHSEGSKLVRKVYIVLKKYHWETWLIIKIVLKNQETDMDIIIVLFDNLPPKIVKAKNYALDSLLTSK